MQDPVILVLDGAQHATVRAALAYYISKNMGEPAYRPQDINDIATGLDEHGPAEVISLDQEALEALASAQAFRLGAMPGDVLTAVSGKESPSAACLLENGVVFANRVVSSWESGDLAGAVNALQEWAGDVQEAFPGLDYSDADEDEEDADEEGDDGEDPPHIAAAKAWQAANVEPESAIAREGREACARGVKWWENPHAAGSAEAYEWDRGHTAARQSGAADD